MKNNALTFLLIFSFSTLFSQALKVELPEKLDYEIYWRDFKSKNRFELDFKNITKSNNEYWRNRADLRFDGSEDYTQHWNHLTKKIKFIEEHIYEDKKGENNEKEYLNIYKFNSFGNITEKVYSRFNGDSKIKETFKWDEHQNIIEYIKYSLSEYTNNQYEIEEKQIFKYNNKHQLVLKLGQRPEKIIYTYNTAGLISKIEHFGWETGPYSGVIATTSDITEEALEKYTNELKNTPLIAYTFEYDSRGNITLEKKEDLEDNEILFNHLYEYNEDNLLSKFSVDSYIFEYFYDDSHLLIKEVLTNTETNEVLKSTSVYNKSKLLTSNSSNGSYGNNIYQHDYKYDDFNNIIEDKLSVISFMGKKQRYISNFEYDSKNQLVKGTTQSEYHWIEKYDYDNLGRLLNYTRTETMDNKIWNEFRSIYDENGGVIEEVWNELIKRKIEYY